MIASSRFRLIFAASLLGSLVGCSTHGPDSTASAPVADSDRVPSKKETILLRALPRSIRDAVVMSDEEWLRMRVQVPSRFRPALYRRKSAVDFQIADIPLGHMLFNEFDPYPLHKIKLNPNASAEAKRCWNVFVSGGIDCDATPPPPSANAYVNGELDLLLYSREVAQSIGMLKATETLRDEMIKLDARGGQLESDVQHAARDKSFKVEGSVVNMSKEERAKTGIFVVFGIDVSGNSQNRELIRRAAQVAGTLGFSTHLLNTEPAVSYEHNGRLIAEQIRAQLPKLDRAIIVAASKGVADSLTALLTSGPEMSYEERTKIRLLVALSGVVRESFIAHWISEQKSAIPFVLRRAMPFMDRDLLHGNPLEGINALAKSPWSKFQVTDLKALYPNLRWISFSMLPDGPDGYPNLSKMGSFMQKHAYKQHAWASPGDGLVETAATFLPPGTGLTQEIVRGSGQHALAFGRFLEGTHVAPQQQEGRAKLNPEAGSEILDSFLRSLPMSHIQDPNEVTAR